MRAKKAKELRKLADDLMPNHLATTYLDKVSKPKPYMTGNTNVDGTPLMGTYKTYTRKLGNCARSMYQSFKD
jgi:hypothetical protein